MSTYFTGHETDDDLVLIETVVRFRYVLRAEDADTTRVTNDVIGSAIDAYLQPEDARDRFTVESHTVTPISELNERPSQPPLPTFSDETTTE